MAETTVVTIAASVATMRSLTTIQLLIITMTAMKTLTSLKAMAEMVAEKTILECAIIQKMHIMLTGTAHLNNLSQRNLVGITGTLPPTGIGLSRRTPA